MENFKITNAKTRFFESKEHYLQFRQAWKDFHNSDNLVWREDVEAYSWSLEKKITMKNVKHTALGAEHYMLYNLLRGHNADRGFSPLTRKGRLDAAGGQPWSSYEIAKREICRAAKDIQDVNSPSEFGRKWARGSVKRMLLPFGDTVSQGVLLALAREISPNIPEFEPEEWQDFTKVEKEEKAMSLADRLSPFRRTA